tara:strand:+ start:5768 stop:6436 length:669 start_codon:yes stop_codon:yes gene_type:complete
MINMRCEGLVDSLNEHCYHILGCGAIGSSAALQIARTGGEDFVLYDFDKVAIENIGVSQYDTNDIGSHKTTALKSKLLDLNPHINVTTVDQRVSTIMYMDQKDIIILGFDNMASRKEIVDNIMKNKYTNPYLLIDGRMGAEHYQQYSYVGRKELQSYNDSWYSDEDGDSEPCNKKATSYCSNMAGAFIVNTIRKVLTNSPHETELTFNFPLMSLTKNTYFPK